MQVLGLPFTQIATQLGRPMVKNVVALGALQAVLPLLRPDAIVETLHHVLKDKPATWPVNEAAFAAGVAAATSVPV